MPGCALREETTGSEKTIFPDEAAPVPISAGALLDGKYRLIRELGEGGMGSVWEARNEAIGKRVAIKLLHDQLSKHPELIRRFQQEARAATAVGNKHIIEVLDLGKLPGGAPYMVMEYLSGCELAELIEDDEPLPIGRAVRLVLQACNALGAAHKKGVIHRDLKPQNLFLVDTEDGGDFVKVLDFGISKVKTDDPANMSKTQTGMTMGTPWYMSPEQARGKSDIDHRTDIYALGCILFELLAHRTPFNSENTAEVLAELLTQPAPDVGSLRSDVPKDLAAAIAKSLEKEPNARFQHTRDFAAAIAPFAQMGDELDGLPNCDTSVDVPREYLEEEPDDELEDVAPGSRGHTFLAIAGAFVVAGAIGVYVLSSNDEEPAPVAKQANHVPAKKTQKVEPPPPPAEKKPATPKAREVKLTIQVKPEHAQVFINGRKYPSTGTFPHRRELSPVSVLIDAKGHTPVRKEIYLHEDATLAAELIPIKAPSVVRKPSRKPAATPAKTPPKKPKKPDSDIYSGRKGDFADEF